MARRRVLDLRTHLLAPLPLSRSSKWRRGHRQFQETSHAMKTVRIAAAQTVEFREDIEAALNYVANVATCAEAEGASLLCFSEGFLQGYLTDETLARRNALDLA